MSTCGKLSRAVKRNTLVGNRLLSAPKVTQKRGIFSDENMCQRQMLHNKKTSFKLAQHMRLSNYLVYNLNGKSQNMQHILLVQKTTAKILLFLISHANVYLNAIICMHRGLCIGNFQAGYEARRRTQLSVSLSLNQITITQAVQVRQRDPSNPFAKQLGSHTRHQLELGTWEGGSDTFPRLARSSWSQQLWHPVRHSAWLDPNPTGRAGILGPAAGSNSRGRRWVAWVWLFEHYTEFNQC